VVVNDDDELFVIRWLELALVVTPRPEPLLIVHGDLATPKQDGEVVGYFHVHGYSLTLSVVINQPVQQFLRLIDEQLVAVVDGQPEQ
jgi:hypothetical protein